ncbi:MAG TPA: SpoIID/LytB domain-containing protein [Thermodesulfovibrionia bacterium]|nr:SpoIID/LytB domain-containing protein [Thermodesulfovibrionia bacterium]
MINLKQVLRIGIIQNRKEISFSLGTGFTLNNQLIGHSIYRAVWKGNYIQIHGLDGTGIGNAERFYFNGGNGSLFTIKDVTIGVQFHWQRQEEQTFQGDLELIATDSGITLVNHVFIENYLISVISSEMSASCPVELLKAHAVISRSWAFAQLKPKAQSQAALIDREGEIIRWYERDSHKRFDLCADDHCQRYQGITNIVSDNAVRAVKETGGYVLVFDGEVCDTRFSKCCGGITEAYANTWESRNVPYLGSVVDYDHAPASELIPLTDEDKARIWISRKMPAYCNPDTWHNLDRHEVIEQILPSFDQETHDFYRWTVKFTTEELGQIIQQRSGIDFGRLRTLTPVERGDSGRIIRLRIEGTKQTIIVGKELEIRKWLSESHLYSSCFVVDTERDSHGEAKTFTLHGAGWGHGVGLCQIGAAVMALNGKTYAEILQHYFPGTTLERVVGG